MSLRRPRQPRQRRGAVRRTRLPPWRAVLAGGLVLGLLAGGAWVVLASSLLAVKDVAVSGTRALSAKRVLSVADVHTGTPLARVDTDAVAARLEKLVRVQDVEVVRRWPSTLAVVVDERRPVASVASMHAGDDYAIVDAEGVQLDVAAEPLRGTAVVEVTGADPDRALRAALDVLAGLPASLRRSVESVSASTPDDVTLALEGDRRVVWGSADRAQRKALVLAAIMSQDAAVYDVSAPDVPTTR